MQTSNINIESFKTLITPRELKDKIYVPKESVETVLNGREAIQRILDNEDKRYFMVVGPCSIHDPNAALEYADKLAILNQKVKDYFFLVMRAYFEKPRTTVGWKGFINDPCLNNTFNIESGLLQARQLLVDITKKGVPVATEVLDPVTPQYLSDLLSWAAIGARTTESQTHREMASGLSVPVGFKNSTDGNIKTAINALQASSQSHHFLGIDEKGRTSIVKTLGNSYCHLILRGGSMRPNYDSVSVRLAKNDLDKSNVSHNMAIDCSHDNSNKNHELQPMVLQDCINQIINGNQSIKGFMMESNLKAGNQKIGPDMKYGISITDSCVDWDTTEKILMDACDNLAKIST